MMRLEPVFSVCRLWWFGRDCCLILDNFKKKVIADSGGCAPAPAVTREDFRGRERSPLARPRLAIQPPWRKLGISKMMT